MIRMRAKKLLRGVANIWWVGTTARRVEVLEEAVMVSYYILPPSVERHAREGLHSAGFAQKQLP